MSAIDDLISMSNDLPFEPAPRKGIAAVIRDSDPALLQGAGAQPSDGVHIADSGLARHFMLAGHATFTVVSKASGNRFTFRLTRPKDEKSSDPIRSNRQSASYGTRTRKPLWISVLSGADNTSDYAYLGTIWEDAEKFTYSHGRKSRISADAPSAKAALWIAKLLNNPALLEQCEIWHAGTCGRCGRKLTVPESIRSGIGPECAKH